ncbi:hypothetical protein [Streptomyces fradiae]|uniref:hypothetical protein n=1 Tax=Streptomyces fradiae TaxID=1906 RepID=UPI0035126EFE
MNQNNPLITSQQEGRQITARTSSSLPAAFEDPKQDRGYGHLTVPLRQRGLEVTVEYGLSDYVVDVALPDGSSMIISPPQEPPSEEPGFPESWTVVRHRDAGPPVYEVVYDSEPDGPDAPYGGSVASLLAAVDTRLDQLGVPPRSGQHPSPQGRAAQAGPVRSPVDPTAPPPPSVPPRVSAALTPSPSARSRTDRTLPAAEPPPRATPPARSSTAPGR